MKKISLLIALLVGIYAQAQWNPNTAVNTLVASSESEDMKAISTSDGKTYVVFWKSVPAPTNYELRMQVLDAAGNQLLGTDGVLVCDTMSMSTYTNYWSLNTDKEDHIYIGVTASGDGSGYLFKMNVAGNHVWANPINVPSAMLMNAVPLSSGDCLVSWLSTSAYAASMQRYDSNGNPVWSGVKTVSVNNGASAPANVYPISSDGYVMVFHELASGINSTLHAQRFDGNGNEVWNSPSQLSTKTTAYNGIYSGTADGDTVYYGYIGKTVSRMDAYIQRINPDGTIPWGANGMDFDVRETNLEGYMSIAHNENSPYVWAISTYANTGQSEFGEYVQKFNKSTGARLFTDNAKEVFSVGSDTTHAGNLQLVNGKPAFLVISGYDNGVSPVTLDIAYLDNNGDFIGSTPTIPVATHPVSKSRVNLLKPVNGQMVAVLIEDKGSGSKIYAQNLVDPTLPVRNIEAEVSFRYINPIQNDLVIQSEENIRSIAVYNTLGQEVYKEQFNAKEIKLNASSWKHGVYLTHIITTNGQQSTVRIVKQ